MLVQHHGLDRIVMLITEVQNVREITAFPKNKKAQDQMLRSTIICFRRTIKRAWYKDRRKKYIKGVDDES